MLNIQPIEKIGLSLSFFVLLFLLLNFSFINTYSQTTMTIYNTTGNSTDAKGSLTIKLNDTTNLKEELQKVISQKLDKENIDLTLSNK
jgi:hypothetical protein